MTFFAYEQDRPSRGMPRGGQWLACVLFLALVTGCGSSGGGHPGDAAADFSSDLPDGDPVFDALEEGDGDDLPDTPTDHGDDSWPCIVAPLYEAVGHYETVISSSGDPADVYHPDPPDLTTGGHAFPIALLLQGANVARQNYQLFATAVASHGFVVVVPDHETISMAGPGLFAEPDEIQDVLAHMREQYESPSSPVHTALDVDTIVVLGHSYGGACGMNSLRSVCEMPFCIGTWSRPAELKAGAFWGTNLAVPLVGTVPDIDNAGLPVILMQGTLDSMATPTDGRNTYDKIQDPPRAYVEVSGANHYGVCNVNNPPGAEADDVAPFLAQAVAIETIARWSALFLRAHLLGDEDAWRAVHVCGDALDPNAALVAHTP